jgi:hypothetical protein
MNFYQNSQMTKDNTESKLNEELHQLQAAFNKLCDDGAFRPVFISPGIVTSVKQINPPYKIGNAEARTAISYQKSDSFTGPGESGEFFVFEDIRMVLSALGTMIAATDNRTSSFYFAGKMFKEKGIKYFPEL